LAQDLESGYNLIQSLPHTIVMAEAKYIPTTDADKAVWLNNFTAKLNVYATSLGVSTLEVNNLQKDNAAYQYVINILEQYRYAVLNLTGYKNMMKHAVDQQHLGAIPLIAPVPAPPPAVPEGIFDRVTKLASRIKVTPSYNFNIGHDLGIISSQENVNTFELQPELKIRLNVGRPHIKWTRGYADSIELYVNRNDEKGFVVVGRFSRNNYLDAATLAENKSFDEWHYKAIYVIADKLTGQFSNVVSVMVKRV
jgi:hypothetical protein